MEKPKQPRGTPAAADERPRSFAEEIEESYPSPPVEPAVRSPLAVMSEATCQAELAHQLAVYRATGKVTPSRLSTAELPVEAPPAPNPEAGQAMLAPAAGAAPARMIPQGRGGRGAMVREELKNLAKERGPAILMDKREDLRSLVASRLGWSIGRTTFDICLDQVIEETNEELKNRSAPDRPV